MNWLAHLFLSDNDIDYQLGNLLADPLKGRAWHGARPQFHAGLKMHKSIDSFTDGHPLFIESKLRLVRKGCLKGVVMDITYDHLLARHWLRYTDMALDEFVETFHGRARKVMPHYPDSARSFLSPLIESGQLMAYDSMAGVERALRRIDRRLSQRVLRKETTSDYLPLIEVELMDIERDFLGFMPELIKHFKTTSRLSLDNHWLK
jgi:acyl carrier protein phosphodiesterase